MTEYWARDSELIIPNFELIDQDVDVDNLYGGIISYISFQDTKEFETSKTVEFFEVFNVNVWYNTNVYRVTTNFKNIENIETGGTTAAQSFRLLIDGKDPEGWPSPWGGFYNNYDEIWQRVGGSNARMEYYLHPSFSSVQTQGDNQEYFFIENIKKRVELQLVLGVEIRDTTTNKAVLEASPTNPAFMMVEDLGPLS